MCKLNHVATGIAFAISVRIVVSGNCCILFKSKQCYNDYIIFSNVCTTQARSVNSCLENNICRPEHFCSTTMLHSHRASFVTYFTKIVDPALWISNFWLKIEIEKYWAGFIKHKSQANRKHICSTRNIIIRHNLLVGKIRCLLVRSDESYIDIMCLCCGENILLCSHPTARLPERTPSLVAHHQPSTSSQQWMHIRPCQELLVRAPHLADLASTSTPRTDSVTSASPLSRLAQGPTPSGSCTSGSSATSSVTAAQRRLSTPRPQSTLSVPALHPLCLPPLQHPGLKGHPAVCRYHLHLQISLHPGLHLAAAEPCRPLGGRTRQLNVWQSGLWAIGPWSTSPLLFPPAGPNLRCSR